MENNYNVATQMQNKKLSFVTDEKEIDYIVKRLSEASENTDTRLVILGDSIEIVNKELEDRITNLEKELHDLKEILKNSYIKYE